MENNRKKGLQIFVLTLLIYLFNINYTNANTLITSASTPAIISTTDLASSLPGIMPEPLELKVGEVLQTWMKNFSFTNEYASFVWLSKNENIAIVDEKGEVMGISEGETMLQAYISKKDETGKNTLTFVSEASLKVMPSDNPDINSIPTFERIINKGEWMHFSDLFPDITSSIRMQVNTTNIVSIDYNFNIFAANSGKTILKCFDPRGTLKAVCKIVVQNDENWKPDIKKVTIKDLRTVIIEFNTDIFIDIDSYIEDLIKIEIINDDNSSKSESIIYVTKAYFEDGTRTLVIELNRDINIFVDEAIRIYSDQGFFAFGNQTVSFELFIGDVNVNTSVNSAKTGALKVFPNPANNELNIESSIPVKRIELFSKQGNRIYNGEAFNTLSNVVNLSGLSSGLYFVRVEDVNGGIKNIKVLKH